MISTLWQCYSFEQANPKRVYGPVDISGSFTGLLNRGLLIVLPQKNRNEKSGWQITPAGLAVIKMLGKVTIV